LKEEEIKENPKAFGNDLLSSAILWIMNNEYTEGRRSNSLFGDGRHLTI